MVLFYSILSFCFLLFLRQSLTIYPRLTWNLTILLPQLRTIGVSHHSLLVGSCVGVCSETLSACLQGKERRQASYVFLPFSACAASPRHLIL